MGADFVLAKQHDIFKHINHIGIVAKVGKLHQNFSDVERQIAECLTIPRFFRDGKEEIYISEVRVVVTKNITGGAQKKIRANFKSSKIEFISGKRLEELIDEYLPIFWTDLSLQVSDYLKTLEEKTRELDQSLNLFDFADNDLYIEQDIYERVELDYRQLKSRRKSKNKKVNINREIEKEKLILIEGGMGAGKSKLLRQLVLNYSKPDVFKETNLFPIFITFRQLSDDFDANLDALIQSKLPPQLQEAISDCTYIILIDGLDEKKFTQDEQLATLEKIKQQVLETPNIKAVITTRRLSALEKAHDINRQIARYDLRPLTLNKTIEFIQALCSRLNVKNRIIEDLKKSPLFRELPRSPIAAILLAKLLNENSEELPSNLTELYSKYSELMLGRWDVKKGLHQSGKEYETLNNVVMQLARYSIENEIDIFSVSDAKNILNSYLDKRNLELDSGELFDNLITRSEIIVADSDQLTLKFKHRTFAEFFYAKSLLKEEDFTIDERAFEFYWMNTYFFHLGIRKDCPVLLESLYNYPLTLEFRVQW
jgi:energy-coupling factor transporter ATP-binding protein EcfA2